MAMAVRAVGVWRVVSNAVATSTVRCAVEPAREAQQVLPRRSAVAGQLSISMSGDGSQQRCQAATLTAVRELAAADGVLESGVERRCIEESRAALRGSFEAASVSGRALCEGGEECRPALEEARFLSVGDAESAVDMAAEGCEQSRMYYGRRGGGDAYHGMATMKPADIEEDVQTRREMIADMEAVLQGAGRNAEMLCQLAVRAWRKLGDADRAEQLYTEALQLAPQDSAIQASYAQFLWQCDV